MCSKHDFQISIKWVYLFWNKIFLSLSLILFLTAAIKGSVITHLEMNLIMNFLYYNLYNVEYQQENVFQSKSK